MAKPEWLPQRIYQWTKPRSLLLHFLFVVVAGGCLVAMWWQVNRAMQGNALSYFYSVEWPAIAVVVGIGWWQLVHDTPDDIARRTEYHRRMRAASAEVVARTLPRSARALTVDSEEVDGRVLAPAAARAVTAGGTAAARAADLRAADLAAAGSGAAGSGPIEATLLPARPASSEVATMRGDLEARLLETEDDHDVPTDEMTAYNRYLATLALKGKPKTWRNPHGL